MWNPFKRKSGPLEAELDALLERVRADVKARGGFVIIGLANKDIDGVAAAIYVHKFNKYKMIYTIATGVGMGPLETMAAMTKFSGSQVSNKERQRDMVVSPISRDDLQKGQ